MIENTIASIFATTFSILAAFIAQYIARKQKQLNKQSKEQIENIAKIVKKEEANRKSTSLAVLMKKLPSNLQMDDFTKKLEEISSQISSTAQQDQASSDAVENLINGYHEQALDQAKVQFWFSVVAAAIGFGIIIYAATEIDLKNLVTFSKTLPGIVMDAVAFLFFKQAAETRQRATELYDRLRTDKRNAESVSLVSSIEDIRVRSAVKAQIALHMSGLNPAPIDLTNFLSGYPMHRCELSNIDETKHNKAITSKKEKQSDVKISEKDER